MCLQSGIHLPGEQHLHQLGHADGLQAQEMPAKVCSTSLTDQLGQAESIFSDKTGTLTQTTMPSGSAASRSSLQRGLALMCPFPTGLPRKDRPLGAGGPPGNCDLPPGDLSGSQGPLTCPPSALSPALPPRFEPKNGSQRHPLLGGSVSYSCKGPASQFLASPAALSLWRLSSVLVPRK